METVCIVLSVILGFVAIIAVIVSIVASGEAGEAKARVENLSAALDVACEFISDEDADDVMKKVLCSVYDANLEYAIRK